MQRFNLFILIFCTATVNAAPLTLQAAVAKAKDYSPDIKGLQSQFLSAQAKAAQAIAPYEPTLGISYADMPTAFHLDRPASTVYSLNQQIGFPGKALLNRNSLHHAAEAVHAQLQAMQLQVAFNVKSAYLNLAQAQQNILLNNEQQAAYQRIFEIAKRRYAAGAIPQVDLLNAQVNLYGNVTDASDLQSAQTNAQAQLNVLMGVPPDQVFTLEPFKAQKFAIPTLDIAQQKMTANRNELKAARFSLAAAEDAYRFAKMQLLPDLQFSAGITKYNESSATPWQNVHPDYTTTYQFGVAISIPLWGLFNERQVIVGASRDRATADANLNIALNQSIVTLKSTLETLRTTLFRIENNEQHMMPLSEQALSLALINYSAGKIDFQTLADTATSRRNIRRDYFSAVVNYMTAYASLGQLMGEEL